MRYLLPSLLACSCWLPALDTQAQGTPAQGTFNYVSQLPSTSLSARTMQLSSSGTSSYILRDARPGKAPMATLNLRGTSLASNNGVQDEIYDPNSNNDWQTSEMNDPSFGRQRVLDIHWGLQMTLDYWRSRHKWRSYDNLNTKVFNFVNYHYADLDPNGGGELPVKANAYWKLNVLLDSGEAGSAVAFENGNQGERAPTDVSTIGHEFGHGINTSTAKFLPDGRESGPLNEGFADIWGTCAASFANDSLGVNTISIWTDIRNPSAGLAGYPKYYGGNNWSTSYDPMNNTVANHKNCTVIYYWFYLILKGGNGPNERGEDYCVPALGIRKAEKIAFSTAKLLANPSGGYSDTKYSDVYEKSLSATIALYGNDSYELRAVQEAWYAVGVGPKRPDYATYSIGAPTWNCTTTTGTFTLTTSSTSGLPLPAANWTITPADVVSVSSTNGVSQITITQRPGKAGIISITATLLKNCGSTNQTVLSIPQLIVGNPAPTAIQGEYNTPPRRIKAYIDPVPTATSYDWYVNGVLQSTHSISITTNIRNLNSCSDPEVIEVQAQFGSCGAAQMIQRYFYPLNCRTAQASSNIATDAKPLSIAYPNPANESLIIPADVVGVTLLNGQGKLVKKANGAGGLDIHDLPEGLYNLQMWQEGKLINQRIQVKH